MPVVNSNSGHRSARDPNSAKKISKLANDSLLGQLKTIEAMMSRLDPDLNRVAKEVGKLQPLNDDVMAHVNSAKVGLAHNVSRIEHAIAILGRRKTLALIRKKMNPGEELETILARILNEENQANRDGV